MEPKPTNTEISLMTNQDKVAIAVEMTLAKTNFSLNAQRMFRALVSVMKSDDKPFKYYRFRIKDYCQVFNLDPHGSHQNHLRKAGKELKEPISIPLGNGDFHLTSLVNTVTVKDGLVIITVDPVMQDFYKNKLATKYKLLNISNFVNKYSFSLYEMLINADKPEVIKSIEEMKEWLECEKKYSKYSDFKRGVLLPVLSDINGEPYDEDPNHVIDPESTNGSGIRVTIEELKEGKRVAAIKFKITKIKPSNPMFMKLTNNEFYDNLDPETQANYNTLRYIYHVQHSTIYNAIKKYGEIEFQMLFAEIHKAILENGKKIKDKAKFAAACLNKGACENYTAAIPAEIVDTDDEQPVIPPERANIVQKLNEYNIHSSKIIIKILEHDDAYIMGNIQYCVDQYMMQRHQKDISGAIIRAIEDDYAGYEARRQQLEIKRLKDAELAAQQAEEERKQQEEKRQQNEKQMQFVNAEKIYFTSLSNEQQQEFLNLIAANNWILKMEIDKGDIDSLWNGPKKSIFASVLNKLH